MIYVTFFFLDGVFYFPLALNLVFFLIDFSLDTFVTLTVDDYLMIL